MAFRKVTPQVAAEAAAIAAKQAEVTRTRHLSRVADLLKAAETPADTNTHLDGVAKWRHDPDEYQEIWRNTALLQIASGDRPEDVCARLGFGRTALQQAVRAEGSKLGGFAKFLTRPKEAS